MTGWFLIVEDNHRKAMNYREFERHYQAQRPGFEFRFLIAYTPLDAYRLLTDDRRPPGLAGVVADCSLGCSRDDQANFRAQVPADSGAGYEIWTGLGVLDWVHRHEPDVALWTLTDVKAAHAPLFMGAGHLLLGANPLSLGRFTQRGPLAEQLLTELAEPHRYAELNPHWAKVEEASESLRMLLSRSYNDIDSFDWISALVTMPKWPITSRGFERAYTEEVARISGRDVREVKFYTQTFARNMTWWQWSLEDIYRPFRVNRREQLWPVFDEEQKALRAWQNFNPFTDFLGHNNECEEFFTAPDVRLAVREWLRQNPPPAE